MAVNTERRIDYFKDLLVGVILCFMMINNFYNVHEQASNMNTIQMVDPSALPPLLPTRILQQDKQTPLQELTTSRSHGEKQMDCPKNLIYVPNRIIFDSLLEERKIPRIVHMTTKSRCMTQNFVDNIQKWHFPHHSFYLHDDEAVGRLLQKYWASFPHIPIAMRCLRSGASKADLWRYLVLWEYGGIYTDIDNAPGKFWNSTTIQNDDDAFFVVEKLGVLSQFFLAASPKHPLLYLTVQQTLHRLLNVDHVGKQYIPQVTGPGALKVAFKYFMRTQEKTEHGRVQAGKYVGVDGRSVTVAGSKFTSWQIVIRGSVPEKMDGYKQMNMRHFSAIAKKKFNESCMVHLYNLDHTAADLNMTNW